MNEGQESAATPEAILRRRIMDPTIAKSEAEHWARRRIEELVVLLREAERHLCFSILSASPNRLGGEVAFKEHCRHANNLLTEVRSLEQL